MYKWPLLETVQYCYNSGPFKKNRMSSGGYFRQSCHVIKTRVSLINVDKFAECRVLRREGQRAQHVLPLPPSYRHKLGLHSAASQLPRSFLLRNCIALSCSPAKSSALDPLPTFIPCELTSHQRSLTPHVQHCADGI